MPRQILEIVQPLRVLNGIFPRLYLFFTFLFSHFVFSDAEVEKESPTKGKHGGGSPHGRQPTVAVSHSVPAPKMGAFPAEEDPEDEQQQLKAYLEQQHASLAALQEKKRRLEAAQAEVLLWQCHITQWFFSLRRLTRRSAGYCSAVQRSTRKVWGNFSIFLFSAKLTK